MSIRDLDYVFRPDSIALIGASGGAYGTMPGVVLARELWPDTPLDVVNDSGVGVAKEGDPFFITDLMLQWNASSFIPDSCEGCTDRGHLVPLVAWQLEQDPLLRSAVFSSYDDYIISQLFLGLGPQRRQDQLDFINSILISFLYASYFLI